MYSTFFLLDVPFEWNSFSCVLKTKTLIDDADFFLFIKKTKTIDAIRRIHFFFFFQLTSSLAAIAAGVSFGVFTLGMLFPWSNSKVLLVFFQFVIFHKGNVIIIIDEKWIKNIIEFEKNFKGAFIGSVCGFSLASWASYGSNAASAARAIVARKLPVEISHCANVSSDFLNQFNFPKWVSESLNKFFSFHSNYNMYDYFFSNFSEGDVFPLYRLSYHWIAGLGFVSVIIIGLIVSFITGATKIVDIDRNLLTPAIHR